MDRLWDRRDHVCVYIPTHRPNQQQTLGTVDVLEERERERKVLTRFPSVFLSSISGRRQKMASPWIISDRTPLTDMSTTEMGGSKQI